MIVFIPIEGAVILLRRQKNGSCEAFPVKGAVAKGDLHTAAAFLRVEKRAVGFKLGPFVLIAGQGVINIRKLPGLAVFVPCIKKPILPNTLDGYGLLYALGNDKAFLVLPHDFLEISHCMLSSITS